MGIVEGNGALGFMLASSDKQELVLMTSAGTRSKASMRCYAALTLGYQTF
jgi:hypothetical protein